MRLTMSAHMARGSKYPVMPLSKVMLSFLLEVLLATL
jgi:hypothetical protein